MRKVRNLSSAFEEIAHQCAAFFGQNARSDLRLGVQRLGGVDTETAFRVGGTVDDATDLRPTERAGTHHAGFDGDVERAVVEILSPELSGGGRHRLHLGMGGDIVQGFGEVVAAGDDRVAANHHGTDRDFSAVGGGVGFFQGATHVVFVGHVVFL